MTSDWRPFLLIRPCGMPFIDTIEEDIRAAGLVAEGRFLVWSWREVSRRLYFDQYGLPGTDWLLQDGAEAWLETTVTLYGDSALCLPFGVGQPADARLDMAQRLCRVKYEFRRRRRAERTRIRLTYAAPHGSWPIYFDGVHVPEPDPGRIRWELDVIETIGRSAAPTPLGSSNV